MVEEKVDEILKKSIAEIDAMAKERGLTPSDYRTKEEVAKAIVGKPMEPKEPEKPEGKEPEGNDELLKKSRDELNTIAEEKGLDPGEYHNKEELAKAILGSE